MPEDPRIRIAKRTITGAQPTLWYKDAIIYQTHVRAFFDANDDGIGDFPGLTAKLDYIADLGVSALWLLPFYPSPLKDDGYDIADYCAVNPAYGTLDDFRDFVEAAHARGIRVMVELVINHTSDQHPWFQRARRAPKGSPERGFYVWSETGREFSQASIIFVDAEPSNWAWDPVAEPTTGTASTPTNRISTSTILWSFARSRTSSTSGLISGSTAFGWMRSPTWWSARAPPARTCPRRMLSSR